MYRIRNIYPFIVLPFFLICLFMIPDVSAAPKIPKVRLSVKGLDLSRTPTTEELMAAGQLGGQLYPTDNIAIKGIKDKKQLNRNKELNLSFGRAIEEWNNHNYKKAVKMFRKHAEDYPDSPWTDESLLHIGCDARYNGRYSEAEELFTGIIEKNKDENNYGAKMLKSKAKQRLGVLKVLQSNFMEAINVFSELKKESPDWRHRTYASHWIQRISKYKGNELALLNCGTQALAYVLEKDGRDQEARAIMEISPASLKGNSLQDIKSLAERYGYAVAGLRLDVSDLPSIPLPAIIQINAKHEGDRGHYWVLEKINSNGLVLFDSQSGRRFSQETEEFAREWDGNALVFSISNDLPGVRLAENEMEKVYGACCGSPARESDLGKPDKDNDKCKQGQGAPVWDVNMINMNLFVTDTPMWYDPPIGPSVRISLNYNSQSAIANNEPFGNKWQFNYGSYLVVDTGGTVTIFMPDGRRDVYSPDGSGGYTKPYKVYNELTKIAENHFELRFQDDTVYVYNIPSGTSSQQPFLVEIRDAYGQKLTFTYNAGIQLTTITDAAGKNTTLLYNAEGLVYQVNDPFSRSATFEYDANRNLTKITDMAGYWASFDYDADVYITKIEDARGKKDFWIEPSYGGGAGDSYPPPGDGMWANYRITVTNPSGDKEEFFYYAGCGFSTCSGVSWHVLPRDYITWLSPDVNNYRSNAPKTLYYFTTTPSSGRGEISKIVDREGGVVEYGYDNSGNRTSVKDSDGNTIIYSYNSNGRVTSVTDPKGNVTNMTYAANEIDLLEIQNGLGTITITYNSAHDITSVKDRLDDTTSFQYNNYGQLTQSADPMGMVTALTYDGDNQLEQISKSGSALQSFTHDTVGRVDTATDATGLMLDYDYDNLNRITKVTYPDTKFASYTYSGCCPRLVDSVTDRAGRTTTYTYDALKRLIETIDPQGKVMRNEYDDNGNRITFIDTNENVTTFEYDLENRLKKKIYADGKFETYTYYPTGLMSSKTNARGITATYTYDKNYNLKTVSYSDATPGITFTYDNYNRLTQRVDGMGTYAYTYDANSRLKTIDGPWDNDTITLQYNALGQIKSFTPEGGQSVTYYYDYDPEHSGSASLGRLKDIQTGTGTYSYHYSGANPLVQSLARPNGSTTEYLYNDPLMRLTEITNKTSAEAIINKHVFTYNNQDVIDTENVTTGTPMSALSDTVNTYDYNNLNQLLNTTNPTETFIYDDDGNITQGYTPDGYVFTAVYDAENRITSLTYNDGAIDHETKYIYSGDRMLAKVEKYEDTVPVSENRFIRAGFLPIQERDGNNAVTREYTWGLNKGGGIGGLLNLNQGGQDYSYLYDGKGNVMGLIDSAEAVQASYRYDVFGNLKEKTGTIDQPFQFSTKRYDEMTGLSNYGYRFYNPAIGRWMTRDPLGEAGGINLYIFVGNNPVNFVDHWGLIMIGLEIWARPPVTLRPSNLLLDDPPKSPWDPNNAEWQGQRFEPGDPSTQPLPKPHKWKWPWNWKPEPPHPPHSETPHQDCDDNKNNDDNECPVGALCA
jgi:RHS repeat-associated protein